MTIWNNKAFTENEFSFFGKAVVIFLLVIPIAFITARNIIVDDVANPYALAICLIGFFLFLISKISLFRRGVLLSFGTKRLTESMANLYRLGYWLMAVGLAITFLQ